jgi:hypothetical protein
MGVELVGQLLLGAVLVANEGCKPGSASSTSPLAVPPRPLPPAPGRTAQRGQAPGVRAPGRTRQMAALRRRVMATNLVGRLVGPGHPRHVDVARQHVPLKADLLGESPRYAGSTRADFPASLAPFYAQRLNVAERRWVKQRRQSIESSSGIRVLVVEQVAASRVTPDHDPATARLVRHRTARPVNRSRNQCASAYVSQLARRVNSIRA